MPFPNLVSNVHDTVPYFSTILLEYKYNFNNVCHKTVQNKLKLLSHIKVLIRKILTIYN